MASYPIPVFYDLEQTLSTKKERKSMFSSYGRPPKAPVRSAPVRRIYSILKDEAPKPISFREGSDLSFITASPLYSSKQGTYFEQCYEIESRLGEGDFGEVFKVISKENGNNYACKRNILKFRGERDRARRIQEVKNHEQLTPHVNIIKFYRAWEENNQLYLLTEGLDHLHRHKCIHMDVKPENIFIGLDGRCKLGDFGLVIDFSKGYPTEALDGDPKYLAPECLQRVFTPAADIFSLGIVLLEMATDLYLPKGGPLWHDLRSGHFPSMDGRGLSLELHSTIKWLMEPDYRKRPTSTEVLNYKAVKRLSQKNNAIYFIRSKIETFKCYISRIFLLPFIFCSFIYVNFKKKFLRNEEKFLTKDWTPPIGSVNNIQNISNVKDEFPLSSSMMEYRRRVELRPESVPSLSSSIMEDRRRFEALPQPVFNSTPVSSSKRKIFAYYDESLKFKGEDEEEEEENADGSRYTFNESSFSSLELSRETSDAGISRSREISEAGMSNSREAFDAGISTSELRSSRNITGKNLLELFNTAGSSSEEEN